MNKGVFTTDGVVKIDLFLNRSKFMPLTVAIISNSLGAIGNLFFKNGWTFSFSLKFSGRKLNQLIGYTNFGTGVLAWLWL